ncbi:MAG: DUF47 domain-containing protein [Coriobacteriales bacterium]|jgi:uncharacterized protein Yka (UPF0111/DUF47 family)
MSKKKFDYFDAMEQVVGFACEEAKTLERVLNDFHPDSIFDEMNAMHVIENNADLVNHQIYNSLASEFLPPIERDDILLLVECLDDIVDNIEDVMISLYMYNVNEINRNALEIASLIEKSTNALRVAMVDFRNFKKSNTINTLLIDVSDYEDDADKKYVMAIRRLYTQNADRPLYISVWEKIITNMERCCDSCAHAGDVMSGIIMKNS